jgi:hypothetical protein
MERAREAAVTLGLGGPAQGSSMRSEDATIPDPDAGPRRWFGAPRWMTVTLGVILAGALVFLAVIVRPTGTPSLTPGERGPATSFKAN